MNDVISWSDLQRGDQVRLLYGEYSGEPGIIDDFTDDRATMWVRLQDLNERKLILLEDEVEILRA
ncbi:hypothetical protein [Pseudarthrobacter cellobiosi]|uniref:hypothetical protein n=1 Tax=Pseudarthrobacter cellobiosi TaxID=2953654 RepID=UPI00208E36E7|nr:hypothetical protein [Pseudarthrobacter sp. HLT1-5]MCO4253723.1 hypothetical protein [Pseudarthrobacter sp. HLT1-5]